MNEFEYVMALMAIILGLGITHLLAGFGKIIYRLTGHGTPIRFNWVHFLWVVNTFLWMVFYWWYSFSRVGREEWALASYLLMLPFPVFVYLQCVVLYPHRLDEVTDLGAYFMATRRWFFGLMLPRHASRLRRGWIDRRNRSGCLRLPRLHWLVSDSRHPVHDPGFAHRNGQYKRTGPHRYGDRVDRVGRVADV